MNANVPLPHASAYTYTTANSVLDAADSRTDTDVDPSALHNALSNKLLWLSPSVASMSLKLSGKAQTATAHRQMNRNVVLPRYNPAREAFMKLRTVTFD
jgi:hypothetical protein